LVNYNTFIYKGSFTKKTLQNNYDLIVINILARPIMDMAKNISNKLNKNGRVILSGILNTQIFMVANKFRKFGLIIDKNILINKWAIIILKTYVPPKLWVHFIIIIIFIINVQFVILRHTKNINNKV